jgi:hypothetical protein
MHHMGNMHSTLGNLSNIQIKTSYNNILYSTYKSTHTNLIFVRMYKN